MRFPRRDQLHLVGVGREVNEAWYEALPDEAWLALVRKFCSIRPGTEALPDEAWLVPMGRFCSMKPDKEVLPDKAWSAMVLREVLPNET